MAMVRGDGGYVKQVVVAVIGGRWIVDVGHGMVLMGVWHPIPPEKWPRGEVERYM